MLDYVLETQSIVLFHVLPGYELHDSVVLCRGLAIWARAVNLRLSLVYAVFEVLFDACTVEKMVSRAVFHHAKCAILRVREIFQADDTRFLGFVTLL